MDYIGVVLSRDEDGKFTAQRVTIEGAEIILEPIRYGSGRAKKSAVRVASQELTSISQEIQRGEVDFEGMETLEDDELEEELGGEEDE